MKILAFETSCDDTSVAILEDRECLALSTRTQIEHDQTGGVVPEVAARSHANAIFPCVSDVLRETNLSLGDIDVIACTKHPGLLPSLLTGMTVAKMFALELGKPLLWIDHIEGHIFANYLGRQNEAIPFPNITLTVSGGHTDLFLWKSRFELEKIGETRDDAAGEAFDKVAKMLGLGFPGGAKLSAKASLYSGEYRGIFPIASLGDSLDFSFSGIKTAVRREIEKREKLTEEDIREIAFEFETNMIEMLANTLFRASEKFAIPHILLAGGVSANQKLRENIEMKASESGKTFLAPLKNLYSQDNAGMIGIRAYYEYIRKNLDSSVK